MKSRKILAVEQLEDRWCPALTATLSAGLLTISGSADNDAVKVVQDSAVAGTFDVLDGDEAVNSTPFTGVTNVRLNLTAADDQVTVDLGGQMLSGNITANLRGGANTFTVQNGDIGGILTVRSNAPVIGWFGWNAATDTGLDTVTLAEDSSAKNVLIRGGQAGNNIQIEGDVTGNLAIDAFFLLLGSSAGTTVNVSGTVGGSLLFLGSNKGDSLTVSGSVGKGLVASTFGGADAVSISGAVTRGLTLSTGAGQDQITLSSAVSGPAVVLAGSGNDMLTVESTASFSGSALISMGRGDDTADLSSAATIVNMLLSGGIGTDTFDGDPMMTGLTLFSFENQ